MNFFSWGMCLQDIFFSLQRSAGNFFFGVWMGLAGIHYKSNYKGSVKETLNEYVNFYLRVFCLTFIIQYKLILTSNVKH